MKRSDFLKRLGIGLGVAVVAPQVLADMPDKVEALKPVEFKPKTIPANVEVSDEFVDGYSAMYDTLLKPNLYGDYIEHYGKGVGLLEIAYVAGIVNF